MSTGSSLPSSRAQDRPKTLKNALKTDDGLGMKINRWIAQTDGLDLLEGTVERQQKYDGTLAVRSGELNSKDQRMWVIKRHMRGKNEDHQIMGEDDRMAIGSGSSTTINDRGSYEKGSKRFPYITYGARWFLYKPPRSNKKATRGKQKPLPPRVNMRASRAIGGSVHR